MFARLLTLSASLAVAGADGDKLEYAFHLTEGKRIDLAVQMDTEQSFVVTSLGQGQCSQNGVALGDRLVSANGESAERKSNYWLMSHIEHRPLDLVFRHGKNADQECPEEQLSKVYEYVEKGEIVNVRKQLEEFKCDVNKIIEGKPPLMHVAAKVGKIASVRILSFYGGNPNTEFEGSRPLHVAIENGHTFAAHVLVEEKADMEAKNAKGLTPFHVACLHGQSEVLKVLRKQQCDWLSKTADGRTTREVAVEGGHEDLLKLLDLMITQKEEKDKENFNSLLKGAEL